MSPQRFAELIGVTRPAVRAAMDDGRLAESVTSEQRGKVTWRRIDVERGRAEWARNTAPRTETGRSTVELEVESPDAARPDGKGPRPPSDLSIQKARKEKALATKYEIDVARESRALVGRAELERELFELGRVIRDSLSQAAIDLPVDLVGLETEKEAQIILERHAAEAALKVADTIRELMASLAGEPEGAA
ncbi:MAG: hypothetical protein AAFU73_23045 [Planctomycetota bacterium]